MQWGGLTSAAFIKVTSANSCSSQASWTPPPAVPPPSNLSPHGARTALIALPYMQEYPVFYFTQERAGTSGWTPSIHAAPPCRPHNCPPPLLPSWSSAVPTQSFNHCNNQCNNNKEAAQTSSVHPTWDPAQASSRTAATSATFRTASVRPCGSS